MTGGGTARTIRPEEVRARSILQDERTHRVDTFLVKENGKSKYGVLPQPFADMLNVEGGCEIDVFVNLEHGLFIHQIREVENGE